ncbi:MAG: sulfatase [Armatimonadetes bacterium]|nr:sulfatase [Armatimonadota bacterium]
MIRRQFLAATAAAPLALRAAAQPARRPNLLFVFPDQFRGSALGFLGREPVQTPRLDRFSQESLVLTSAASNYPVCSPYRAMLMTGCWPHRNGVLENCTSNSEPFGCELKAADRCWSDVLADQGYSLGYIGKWHLDSPRKPYVDCANNKGPLAWNEWCAPARRHGFDHWYAYGTYDAHLHPMYWANDTPRDQPLWIDQWGPEHEADQAISYLRNERGQRKPDQPFALVVSMNPPHTPYGQVPARYVERYAGKKTDELITKRCLDLKDDAAMGTKLARAQTRNYFACITGVDEQFGRILDELERQGLADNTIVVFTSDHGNCLGCHDQETKNVPYEESMQIPFLIRWPGHIKPRHDDLLLSTPDIAPTLLDLLGHKAPASMQGASSAGLMLTGDGPRPTSQFYLHVPLGKPSGGRRGVRTNRHTMVVDWNESGDRDVTLFDNQTDPDQMHNVAGAQPEVVAALKDELAGWLKRAEDRWTL